MEHVNDDQEASKLSEQAASIVIGGLYRHYKGGTYVVTNIGRHTEDGDELVIYNPINDEEAPVPVRPVSIFSEQVSVDGRAVPRFTYLGELRYTGTDEE